MAKYVVEIQIWCDGRGGSWRRRRWSHGALIGMGIPEYEAKRYEGRVKDGGILLSVHSDTSDQIKVAKDVLKQTGAQDISSTGESAGEKTPTSRVA
jgi:hypothetical protein